MLPSGPSSSSAGVVRASSTPAVPKPAGLLSLGSAEDIAAKAQELKEARKKGGSKTAVTNAAKAKIKLGAEKIEDIQGLKESLPGVPEDVL